MFEILFVPEAYDQFKKLDKSVKRMIAKTIDSLQFRDSGKRLKGFPQFFVKKVGQYRIVYTKDEKEKVKVIYFIGDHKEYGKWYSRFW